MIYQAQDSEPEAVMTVARLMAASARTAPKGRGADRLVTMILTGADKNLVAEQMEKISLAEDIPFFKRDAANVREAAAVVLLGTSLGPLGVPYCGYCGYPDCRACSQADGRCNFNLVDLGIALGAAVAVAAQHHIDNRIMFSFGKTALEMGLLPAAVKIAYGIPLSVSSKNIFFDR